MLHAAMFEHLANNGGNIVLHFKPTDPNITRQSKNHLNYIIILYN